MKQKLLSRLSLIGGILVIIVGIGHTSITPMVYRGFSSVIPDKALGATYFFTVMGFYLVLSGWLMIYASRGLGRSERWAWMISLANGACNVLAGIGAMMAGFRHAFVLTWFVSALTITVLSLVFHASYRSSIKGRNEWALWA